MATGDRKDPFLGFNFKVEIGGVIVAGFNEISGLASEAEIQEFREGGVNGYTHKRAGPIKFTSNLVLKRGISEVAGLWSWYADIMQGKVERKTVSIVLLNAACEEQQRWNFQRAYPVKWSGPSLKATSAEVAVESVELAHEGFSPAMQSHSSISANASFSFSLNVDVSASL
jgi:phage tail-like protein